MSSAIQFKPGDLVQARGREWVVLPEPREDTLKLRPLGGAESDATLMYLPIEPVQPKSATFELPDPSKSGTLDAALLLRDAMRLKLRAGAGPFRSFGNLNVEPRPYQLVPLLMALKLDPIRLLIADDVGIGKTIEAGLIAREMLDRGEITQTSVICPPHLCDQWQAELAEKFNIEAVVVRGGTAARLERSLLPGVSIFEHYAHTVVSLDYIKSDRRIDEYLRTCPNFVIVDEAHTCTNSNTTTKQLRYRLVRQLSEAPVGRSMIFLTATPHSGDDIAFYNLLGLLDPKFRALAEIEDTRSALRQELASHFVQRQRGDIKEWQGEKGFPVRENREETYRLSGAWGKLFGDIQKYARKMVQRTEGESEFRQRVSWWAALGLLRCAGSSPAAAAVALHTRLRGAQDGDIEETIDDLEQAASDLVLDETEDSVSISEAVPAGTDESVEDSKELQEFMDRANSLRGPKKDAKLKLLGDQVKALVREGFRPVVFCRFIATAHYVGEELSKLLPVRSTNVLVITGEIASAQREERIAELKHLDEGVSPVLVATDCLSEGINLQDHFDAVVHYDLTWNPTRHEQREGRADRFGQSSPTVRTLMLYGADNPIDGAVLKVIIRKAEAIKKELGVPVPMPADNKSVVEAIVRSVLLKGGDYENMVEDMVAAEMDFGESEREVENAWQVATSRVTRTIFAQNTINPEDVLPELERVNAVLGGEDDIRRFVHTACQRLGTPLIDHEKYFRIPIDQMPPELREQFQSTGLTNETKLTFEHGSAAGATYIHRTHPLVSAIADYVSEETLEDSTERLGARSCAIFTRQVEQKTVLFLLRVRCHLKVERRHPQKDRSDVSSLMAEECIGVALKGNSEWAVLEGEEAHSLLDLEPGKNMEEAQKRHLIQKVVNDMPKIETTFDAIAANRAEKLLDDHERMREASRAKGLSFSSVPATPVDKVGIYVFMPIVGR